jgi:phospholipid/cholesterol/gamma-HCH transport system permease protein
MARWGAGVFEDIGLRVYFLREIFRALGEPRTYLPLTVAQMRTIGVDSIPLVGIVAAFIGAVTAYQTTFQLFPGVQLSVVGWITRQSLVLELGPLLTALVLAGRVGARMTAEIGTMRVTEQIDALTTLSTNPYKYLVAPRVVAAVLTLPLLVLIADIIGVMGGFVVGTASLHFNPGVYISTTVGFLKSSDVTSGLIKAAVFGFIIALMGCFHGFNSKGGAQGVGRATTNAVVSASILILASNYVMTSLLFAK